MRNLLLLALVLGSLAPKLSHSQGNKRLFKIVCRVGLDKEMKIYQTKVFSEKNLDNATINIELGSEITLSSTVLLNKPHGGDEVKPTFLMSLTKGNPVEGQINFVRVQGLEMFNNTIKEPLTLFGLNFVPGYGRIDYNCSLVRNKL